MSVVYTTVFGRTDPLHEPACKSNWRFVCFTDQPINSDRWEIIRIPKLDAPKRECRKLKQRPHVLFPEADVTLWLDCCLTMLKAPEELAAEYQGDVTAFVHHKRTRITQEAKAIIQARKGRPEDVGAQLAAYNADGWDTDESPQQAIHNGGFLLRRNNEAANRFGDLWNHEVQTRCLRDQMSIDYCAWKAGLKIDDFRGTIPSNQYVRIRHYRTPTNDY